MSQTVNECINSKKKKKIEEFEHKHINESQKLTDMCVGMNPTKQA